MFGGAAMVVLALGTWVFSVSAKQSERNKKIEGYVSDLQMEADKIRRENETLREKITYFSSQDFREQGAKKLGYQYANETVVVIRPGAVYDGRSNNTPVSESATDSEKGSTSQLEKWYQAFFR
jgi:hypothetical protein